jgi:Zn-dependent protease
MLRPRVPGWSVTTLPGGARRIEPLTFGSLNIGRYFGIPVYIHWSFWLLPLWVLVAQPGGLPVGFILAVVFAMFGCVVLHEFGHVLTARGFGIGTRDVTLYPIGGVASLERMSEKAGEEFVIAIAGPMVNVMIAGLIGVGLGAMSAIAPAANEGTLPPMFLQLLMFLNIMMVGFNLIPAFPLDGGRIFRAALAGLMPRLKATRIAVAVGSVFAVLMAIVGLLQIEVFGFHGSPMLALIGLFVFMAGQQELRYLEHRERFGQRHYFEERAGRAWPVVEPEENEPPAPRSPGWARPPVTVYVWNPATGEWVRDDAQTYTSA